MPGTIKDRADNLAYNLVYLAFSAKWTLAGFTKGNLTIPKCTKVYQYIFIPLLYNTEALSLN